MKQPRSVTLEEIRTARERLKGAVLHSPLIRLNAPKSPAEIYLKLENLQPVGSFKLRGAGNTILAATESQRQDGVWTASTGNMAQGVAWFGQRLGLKRTIVGPKNIPPLKQQALRKLGAEFVGLSWETYFNVLKTWQLDGMEGLFVHPFADPMVMAGNGTIALEILEDCPDVEAILVAYGGGGLAGGIGAALHALKPETRLYACEASTGGPLGPSLAAGEMVTVSHTPSFVDAIGSPSVFPQMWPLVRELVDDSFVLPLEEIAAAIHTLATHSHIIAEGAGALPVAAALSGRAGSGKIVCVVSGGNLDPGRLVTILKGGVPR